MCKRIHLLGIALLLIAGFSSGNLYAGGDEPLVPLNYDSLWVQIRAAIPAQTEGVVFVRVWADETGKFVIHDVLAATDEALRDTCLRFVPHLRFSPAKEDGIAVRGWTDFRFEFAPTPPYYPSTYQSGTFAELLKFHESWPRPLNLLYVSSRIRYPEAARIERVEGVVGFRILVDEKGAYVRHETLAEIPLLTEVCEAQLPELRYAPTLRSGKPIRYWTKLHFRFDLAQGGPGQFFWRELVVTDRDFSE